MKRAMTSLGMIVLSGCAAPVFVDANAPKPLVLPWVDAVNFSVENSWRPTCIAVLPFDVTPDVTTEEAAAVRRAIAAELANRRARTLRLAEVDEAIADRKLRQAASPVADRDCDAALNGSVTEYSKRFLGLYSEVAVAAKMTLIRVRDQAVIWRGDHRAASRAGGIPTTPIGLATDLVETVNNVRDEQRQRVTSDLARRLVSTIPDLEEVGPAPNRDVLDAGPKPKKAPDPMDVRAVEHLIQSGDLKPAESMVLDHLARVAGDRDGFLVLGVIRELECDLPGAVAAYTVAAGLEPPDGLPASRLERLHRMTDEATDACHSGQIVGLASMEGEAR